MLSSRWYQWLRRSSGFSSSSGAGGLRPGARRVPTTARRFSPPKLEALECRIVPSSGYDFGTIDDPQAAPSQSPYSGTAPITINDSLQIVGDYTDANGVYHGFLFSKRTYTTLDNPQAGAGFGQGTLPGGIGPLGQIVGDYVDSNNVNHGYLLTGGQYTTLDDPNAATGPFQGSYAERINASGQIVGVYIDANSVGHGYLLSGGQYTTLDDPNAGTGSSQGTYSYGINASGQIVGQYIDANGLSHGFLFSGGQYTTLDDPNANGYTIAEAINDSGQIVGGYGYPHGPALFHGFLFSGGQYTTVDDPKSAELNPVYSTAFGINNSGQITGIYRDANFLLHGYAANPVNHGALAPASLSAGSAAMSDRGPSSMLRPGHLAGRGFSVTPFGNVLVVSPRAPSLNVEATALVTPSVPAKPSTLVGPGLVSSAVPQGQTSSAVRAVAKPDAAGKALDQVFANFHDPLATVLRDA